MQTKFSGIYAILVVQIGMFYVGSAGHMLRRWTHEHLPALRGNRHWNKKLQEAFNEYGEDNFVFFPIETVEDIGDMPERERFFIVHLKEAGLALNSKVSGTPGMRGHKHTLETREKMSEAKRGDEPLYAFLSPEGIVFEPRILNEFCREHDLNAGCMCRVAQGKQAHHQGWKKFEAGNC